jgi:molybdopterin/thiamine biosynthesis adenylyltransferase
MNRDELFRRTKALLNPEQARREVFCVVGCGSGGGRLAEEAARFGVGRIILVDLPGERLEEHNIIRHVLGYRDLGRLKAEALRDHLLNINPGCAVETVGMDVGRDRGGLSDLVARSTQVHLCTDNERSKYAVNEAAVRHGVPLIFAGVFDGGCAGEVGRVMPGAACYACVAAWLKRSARFEAEPVETFDYSNPDSMQRSTAALNLDIAQIALIQARVGLLTMLARQDPSQDLRHNYILFANRPVPELGFDRMLSGCFCDIPKDPECMICGQSGMTDEEAQAEAEAILSGVARETR